jgi:H+/Na+-translocating ferredoxin:NAD+ oxidoreductase subunit B
MTWVTVGLSAGTLVTMAVVFTYILGWANKRFHVEVDPRVEAINDALPGANCGGCGFVGCSEYAEAVVAENTELTLCNVGGASCSAEIATIMGVVVGESIPFRPIVHCGAKYEARLNRHDYQGEMRCAGANIVADVQGCTYGCLGFGDCQTACDYDAIHMVDGLATVDYEKCIGCKACSKVCPRNIITMAPFKSSQMLAVTCSNEDPGKEVKKVCSVGCMGCKACTRVSSVFKMENSLSTIDYDEYTAECELDMLKACEKCPQNRLVFVGKPSPKDLEKTKGEELPEVVTADFKTTVDDTEWRG